MEDSSIKIAHVLFNPSHKELIFSRYRSVKLNNRETLILQYLVKNQNKAITLTEIIQQCLSQYHNDPIVTRKNIQQLSAKLESADFIEYPYIDCYLFRCQCQSEEKLPLFNFKRLKRLFNRTPQMNKQFSG